MESVIILSPSKEMNIIPGQNRPIFSENTQKIYNEILTQTKSQIINNLSIPDSKIKTILTFYEKILESTAKQASQVYKGLAFRQIEWEKINPPYLEEHLFILSCFYGPISATDNINPYRLDFNSKIKINNQTLKNFWKEIYTDFFNNKLVYNLASDEFSSVLDSSKVEMIDISFFNDINSMKKVPSATAKKLRGALANHLLLKESFSKDTFDSFSVENYGLYSFDPSNNKIIYVKNKKD